MKISEIYRTAVELGMEKDIRGSEEISRLLKAKKDKYEKMSDDEKELYDKEELWNPYGDTRILYGDPDLEIKTALVGIDMETPEIILADALRSRGRGIDLIIAHHPEGMAYAGLHEVMSLQADMWEKQGVPINVGDSLIGKRIGEVRRGVMPQNHNRPVDAARLLDIPYMCVHTPADNNVQDFLTNYMDEKKPYLVSDVVGRLKEIPEYKTAAGMKAGPNIICGSADNRAGKIMVDMTGGTQGPVSAMEKLGAAGVGTLIAMHYSEKIKEEAEKRHINCVIAGHIASDSIGLNLIFDKIEGKGLDLISCSGYIRFSRVPNSK